MAESDFILIENNNILDKMFVDFDDFHDALLKEVFLFTDSYIDGKGLWHDDLAPHHARLLFQSQSSKVMSLELTFSNLKTINIRFNHDFMPSGTIEKDKVVFSLAEEPCTTDFLIVAKQLKYRFLYSNPMSATQPQENHHER